MAKGKKFIDAAKRFDRDQLHSGHEAVELAKELSTDDSPGFVNGVLGQVMLVTPQIRAAANALRPDQPQ